MTAAKQLVSLKEVAIDMPAGPSEVEVIADESANPAFIAADFLSQAEHGVDSQAILVTASGNDRGTGGPCHPRATQSFASKGNYREIISAQPYHRIERFAGSRRLHEPIRSREHLIIQTADYTAIAERIENAGSVFMGPYTPESAGDYASGTNHTLPTNGYAKAYSGVNLDSFIKKITFQEITSDGIRALGSTIQTMAANEQLDAHRNAVTIRLNTI